ncbi:MAG: phosphoribosylformylglycinamidine cyclo-ligase [Bacteroidia bacterium]|nr:phosphoribosylformylglycinamidine cyclo-ligase [Bacteroidia bacterium]MDW8014536.1 phosphoribosylformylglycinamidine cyclo-ligase [Bacteroidia bacterium]
MGLSDWYRRFGVSAHKGFLRRFETAKYFAPVGADIAGDPAFRFALHADGVGTKGILAYLWWKESGEISVWHHLAQDALVMNTDDLACSGITSGFIFSTTITRNPFLIPDEIVQALIEGFYLFAEKLRDMGIAAIVAGGETADMPDVVRTIGVEGVAAARISEKELIPLRPPDTEVWIVGVGSFGQASYEDTYNSGIGCNGITAARHLLLSSTYRQQYPETTAPEMPETYLGKWHLTDSIQGHLLGHLLTAPTRTYLPFLREVYQHFRQAIYAVIHCTGGGQRKAIKYLPFTLIRKDNFFSLPPLFALLEGARPWRELFEVFNMGHRLELYTLPQVADDIIAIAKRYNIPAQIVGSARPSDKESRIEASFAGEHWIWEL